MPLVRSRKWENSEVGKEWRRLYNKNYLVPDPRQHYVYQQSYHENNRAEVIENYGGKCKRCGIADQRVLVIDHILNDANIDISRSGRKLGGKDLYSKIRKEGFPQDRYQLLCHNCNYLKELDRRTQKRMDRYKDWTPNSDPIDLSELEI